MNIEDRGPWVATRSGGRFYLNDMRAEDFHVEDMAAGIAKDCRFAGQLAPKHDDDIYVVAQHSVYVDLLLHKMGREDARPWGIVHDLVEGIYGDMTSPQKAITPEYVIREDRAQAKMIEVLNVPYNDSIAEAVHIADRELSIMEANELLITVEDWAKVPTLMTLRELDPDFYCWRPKMAMDRFLAAMRAQLPHL